MGKSEIYILITEVSERYKRRNIRKGNVLRDSIKDFPELAAGIYFHIQQEFSKQER